MENMYVWLFLFAGATIAFLAMLLLASERELRKKRRELQDVLRNRTDNTLHPSPESQDSEPHSSAQNQELLEKISILSSRLEESQRAVDELQTEQHRSVGADCDKQQLEQTIVNLSAQLQMSENRHSESAGQAQEIADRNTQLQTELGELARQHQASQATIAELQAGQERILLDAQSEKQTLCVENQQLQQEIADLRNQLQTSETRLGTNSSQYTELTERHSQLEFNVAGLKQQLDQLTMKNDNLSEEKNTLSSKLAAAQRTIEDLQTVKEGAQSENQQLQAANQEIQRELAKLNLELQTSERRLGEAAGQAQDIADRHAKLQGEAGELKEQLQSSQKTIEELRAEQERLAEVHFENQKLRQEAADLRDQLQTSETRLGDLGRQNQEAADHYARLKNEAADLTRQLEETQPKIRELDALQQELARVEAREIMLISRQDDQETQIAALQRELSEAEGKAQESDAARNRLAEMERLYQELRNENRRLEEEIARWRERLGSSEENQRRIDALRQPLDESPLKHAQLLDLKDDVAPLSPSDSDLTHILQSATDAGGELAREPIAAAAHPVERIPLPTALSQAKSSINGSGEPHDDHTSLLLDGSEAGMAVENGAVTASDVRTPRRKKSRMATVSAVIVLSIATAGAVGFLGTRYFASEDAPVTREFASDERSMPIEAASQTAETKPALRLQGKFKITRATEVYSGPTEKSALITRIEPGMKINVVDSRDGWLEIRSKHGRPPGFVREEAAVKIDQN